MLGLQRDYPASQSLKATFKLDSAILQNVPTLTLKHKLGSPHDVCGVHTVAVTPPGKDAESRVLADGI